MSQARVRCNCDRRRGQKPCVCGVHPDAVVTVAGTVPRIQRRVRGSRSSGGIVAEIHPVHTYECPYWRIGTKHGPCDCGAVELWEQFLDAHGADPWSGVRAAEQVPAEVTR